jgi:hypothetical protein
MFRESPPGYVSAGTLKLRYFKFQSTFHEKKKILQNIMIKNVQKRIFLASSLCILHIAVISFFILYVSY